MVRTGYMAQAQVLADIGGTTVDPALLGADGTLSMENVPAVLGDVDAFLVVDLRNGSPAALAENPIWQGLPAVAAGRVQAPVGNTNFGSVYTAIFTAQAWDTAYGLVGWRKDLMTMRLAILAAGIALVAGPAFAQDGDTITYTYGAFTAELPANPERVLVLDNRTGLEFALLAGYPIVATDADEAVPTHLDALLGDDVDRLYGFRAAPSAEVVLSYDPDLLVVGQGWWTYWQTQGLFPADAFPVLVADGSACTASG